MKTYLRTIIAVLLCLSTLLGLSACSGGEVPVETTNNEIVTTIEGLSANTKCFYARLLGEFGLISIIYYMFLYYCVKNKTRDVFIRFWLVACFIMMLQFDSFCFFPFMIFLAFYNNTTKEEEIING